MESWWIIGFRTSYICCSRRGTASGVQAMVEEDNGGNGLCGSPVWHAPQLQTPAGGGGWGAVVALLGPGGPVIKNCC